MVVTSKLQFLRKSETLDSPSSTTGERDINHAHSRSCAKALLIRSQCHHSVCKFVALLSRPYQVSTKTTWCMV